MDDLSATFSRSARRDCDVERRNTGRARDNGQPSKVVACELRQQNPCALRAPGYGFSRALISYTCFRTSLPVGLGIGLFRVLVEFFILVAKSMSADVPGTGLLQVLFVPMIDFSLPDAQPFFGD